MTDATKLADELLPCPFCGNTDIRHDHPNRAPRVYCGSCRVSASSPEHWNTRCLPQDGDNYVPWPWSEGDQSALRERDALAAQLAAYKAMAEDMVPLLLYHETGGHEGDGSEERLALIRSRYQAMKDQADG